MQAGGALGSRKCVAPRAMGAFSKVLAFNLYPSYGRREAVNCGRRSEGPGIRQERADVFVAFCLSHLFPNFVELASLKELALPMLFD